MLIERIAYSYICGINLSVKVKFHQEVVGIPNKQQAVECRLDYYSIK